ncbi:type VI secretion system-associated protein TagF [Zavarzinia compransoris]|uniref:Type VI secretion system-associated protein TagF n=1 Tax=Zavarzinia compransoris TaxID=1264899 RepID=A0A317EAL6_9PROT|nr:type VI secretion system-associated protein TagF [Zavarzinia compransoris]PWR22343.1 type VI secretion system-associated protein TagF [Zavarzinia compransoris]TDP46891.1 type VI secretion system protein ImpM [Zavarzinia compransoris]
MPGDSLIGTTAALAAVPVPGMAAEAAPPGERNLPPPRLAGFYGKLPARGDFVGRRLSEAFVETWDRFLTEGLTAAAGRLGGGFADRYLVSPFWRFALGPGIAGPETVVGVFAPSVDRVGRYFPLTAALELPGESAPAALAAAEAWLPLAEQAIYDALMPDGSLETLDDTIAALPVAPPPAAAPAPEGGRMVQTSLLAQGLLALAAFPAPPVLFWTLGSVELPPRLLSFGALPSPTVFAAFLDGAWEGDRP